MKRKYLLFPALAITIFFSGCKKDNIPEDPNIDFPIEISIIDSDPTWSPDGQRIAYYHFDENYDYCGIYLINPDGDDNFLWHQGYLHSPSWSPDGRWIAFSANNQIWKKKVDGDSLTQITFNGRNHFPSWSPDSKKIVYTQTVCSNLQCGLWLYNKLDSSNNPIVQYGSYPDYNPINERIFYVTRWVENDGEVLGDSVYTYDHQLKSKEFITTLQIPNFSNWNFRYSNNGSKVLFVSSSIEGNELPSLWVMDSDGSNIESLLPNVYAADWNPDGDMIVYTDCRPINGRLWILDNDGNTYRQLTYKHLFN